jgi:hypothetical protein
MIIVEDDGEKTRQTTSNERNGGENVSSERERKQANE